MRAGRWFRQQELLKLLLERGASPAKANNSGETPVHWAAKSTNIQARRDDARWGRDSRER